MIRIALAADAASFDLASPALVGRQVANDGLLRALRESGSAEVALVVPDADTRTAATGSARVFPASSGEVFRWADVVVRASPMLSELTVGRATGDRPPVFGITHSISSARVLREFGAQHEHLTARDGIICTSHAVRGTVLSAQRVFGPAEPADVPRTGVLPLGFHASDFRDAAQPGLRAHVRERFRLGPDEITCLYFGRINYLTKACLADMFLALDAAAARSGQAVTLLLAGWFPSVLMARQVQAMARQLAPGVGLRVLDGRDAEVRRDIWAAADVFISLADNIQESFGLTPIQAMAAGLPCVVSDWDGYKDTVRDGVDGYRIQTLLPPRQVTEALLGRQLAGQVPHDLCVGTLAQLTTVDVDTATARLAALFRDPDLRKVLGSAGRERAMQRFEWRQVIGRYLRLFQGDPAWDCPSVRIPEGIGNLFDTFPTGVIEPDWSITRNDARAPLLEPFLEGPMRRILGDVAPAECVRQIWTLLGGAREMTIAQAAARATFEAFETLCCIGWMAKHDLVRAAPPAETR